MAPGLTLHGAAIKVHLVFQFDKRSLSMCGPNAFTERRNVRFQDVDAAGIVFFAKFFEYFHDAYTGFLDRAGCPLHSALTEQSWLAPIRHAEADYLKPLRLGNQISVTLTRAYVAATEITLGFRIADTEGSLIFAVGQTVHTFVTPKTFQRCSVPDLIVAACCALEP